MTLVKLVVIMLSPSLLISTLLFLKTATASNSEALSLEIFNQDVDLPECNLGSVDLPESPYRVAIDEGLRPEEAFEAWEKHFSTLPDKCFPLPYNDARFDGEGVIDAFNAWSHFREVRYNAQYRPELGSPYIEAIKNGYTPGKAYIDWMKKEFPDKF